jgi:hypothetical protein
MPKRIIFISLLIAFFPGIEAREPDLSLSNHQFDREQPVEKQKAGRSTWFGIGYESRREQAERATFEDNAMRESVFSWSSGSTPSSSPGTVGVTGGGSNGTGGRR